MAMAPGELEDWEASTDMHTDWETPASPIPVPSYLGSPIYLDSSTHLGSPVRLRSPILASNPNISSESQELSMTDAEGQIDKEGGANGCDEGIEQQRVRDVEPKDGTGDGQGMKEIEELEAQHDSPMHAAEHNATITVTEVPLTYDNISNGSALLTRYAAPGKKRKAYEGRVGNILKENILVTSPNVDYLYAPPLTCHVRLRQDNHFGSDDPLFLPQPFDIAIGHLALIMPPENDPAGRFFYAWKRPGDKDFVPQDTNTMSFGLGVLETNFQHCLRVLCKHILNQVPQDTSDNFLLEGSAHLYRLLDILPTPSTRKELFLRVACTQRTMLELKARLRFLDEKWVSRFRNAKLHKKAEDIVDAVGAFTESLDDLDLLYYAGIPVWYVRNASQIPNQRIDKVVDFIKEDSYRKITLHRGEILDCSDASPAHRVVYTGLAANSQRYRNMGRYIRSLFQPPSLLGSRNVISTLSPDVGPSTQSLGSDRSSRHRFKSFSHSEGEVNPRLLAAPYKINKGKGKKEGANRNRNENIFLSPLTPLMPLAARPWELALRELSDYNQSLPRPMTVNSGYWLPPARCFVTPKKEESRARLFSGWTKMRSVMLYQLGSLDCSATQLSTKDWRSMIEIVAGGEVVSTNQETRSGKRFAEMRQVLQQCFERSSVSVDLTLLPKRVAMWDGQFISPSQDPKPQLAAHILWELCELNFRNELIMLDSHLDKSGMDTLDRQELLEKCWVGSSNSVDFRRAGEGLGASAVKDRLPFVRALHRLAGTWQGEKPVELIEQLPELNSHNFQVAFEKAEIAIARFYTQSFLAIFGRAASIPHCL